MPQIPTPLYDHIRKFPSVYEPSEDTFLLIDTLQAELPFISALNPIFIAEIGSGSGVNITALAMALGDKCVYYATDINPQACLATKITATTNHVHVNSINASFLSPFKNSFDVILFNPPYVVTESDEIAGDGIERSWAGGANGREVMDELFPLIPGLLARNGVFYLVAIEENDPRGICGVFERMNFHAQVINDRKVRGEHLYILKFQKL